MVLKHQNWEIYIVKPLLIDDKSFEYYFGVGSSQLPNPEMFGDFYCEVNLSKKIAADEVLVSAL